MWKCSKHRYGRGHGTEGAHTIKWYIRLDNYSVRISFQARCTLSLPGHVLQTFMLAAFQSADARIDSQVGMLIHST